MEQNITSSLINYGFTSGQSTKKSYFLNRRSTVSFRVGGLLASRRASTAAGRREGAWGRQAGPAKEVGKTVGA